ncbi:MAG: thioredoxin family protein [Phycisphaerae bacterium]|nr:thioredoxin family protein [Phycisphaerae bacterium]
MDVKLKVLIGVLSVFLMAGYTAVNAGQNEEKDKTTGNAPDFVLKDVNGNQVQLSGLKGKVVVLEWTNYDCPFVKAHYNDRVHTMTDLAKKYADQGVIWLTINSTHYATPESIKTWADKQGIEKQTLLVDTDGTVGRKYNAKTTPHLFIIDKNAAIVYQGAIDNAPMGRKPETYINYVDQALTQLLANQEITVPHTKSYGCSVKYSPEENKANQ